MLRRTVSLLLVPIVLLGQLAPAGHSHVDGSDGDHNGQPHIHVDLVSHHHANETHHHKHPHPHAMHEGSESNGLEESFQPLHQHDDDAIYLALKAAVSARRVCCDNDNLPAVLDVAIVQVFIDHAAACGSYVFRPPPEDRFGPCPIYIRHLTLLV